MQMVAEKMKPAIDLYKTFEQAQNPMGLLQQAAESNDIFKSVLSMTNAANGNPKDAFYVQAKQMGLSDEAINTGLAQIEQLLNVRRPS